MVSLCLILSAPVMASWVFSVEAALADRLVKEYGLYVGRVRVALVESDEMG